MGTSVFTIIGAAATILTAGFILAAGFWYGPPLVYARTPSRRAQAVTRLAADRQRGHIEYSNGRREPLSMGVLGHGTFTTHVTVYLGAGYAVCGLPVHMAVLSKDRSHDLTCRACRRVYRDALRASGVSTESLNHPTPTTPTPAAVRAGE